MPFTRFKITLVPISIIFGKKLVSSTNILAKESPIAAAKPSNPPLLNAAVKEFTSSLIKEIASAKAGFNSSPTEIAKLVTAFLSIPI